MLARQVNFLQWSEFMTPNFNIDSLSEPEKENIHSYLYLMKDEYFEVREFIKTLSNYKPFKLDVRHATTIQKALNIALVVSYSRNFRNSHGIKYQDEINRILIDDFENDESELHQKMKDQMNQEFAHSDATAHDIRLNEYTDVKYSSRVVRELLDKDQLDKLLGMVTKIQKSVKKELEKLE